MHLAFEIHEIKNQQPQGVREHLAPFAQVQKQGRHVDDARHPEQKTGPHDEGRGANHLASSRHENHAERQKLSPKYQDPGDRRRGADDRAALADSLRDKNGHLPEFVHNANGKWKVYKEGDGRRLDLRRARCDIKVIVDGKRIDLNRIPLPSDTSIIDQRVPAKSE